MSKSDSITDHLLYLREPSYQFQSYWFVMQVLLQESLPQNIVTKWVSQRERAVLWQCTGICGKSNLQTYYWQAIFKVRPFGLRTQPLNSYRVKELPNSQSKDEIHTRTYICRSKAISTTRLCKTLQEILQSAFSHKIGNPNVMIAWKSVL